MTHVVKFPNRKPVVEQADEEVCYSCSVCGNTVFHIWEDGELRCAECDTPISDMMAVNFSHILSLE